MRSLALSTGITSAAELATCLGHIAGYLGETAEAGDCVKIPPAEVADLAQVLLDCYRVASRLAVEALPKPADIRAVPAEVPGTNVVILPMPRRVPAPAGGDAA